MSNDTKFSSATSTRSSPQTSTRSATASPRTPRGAKGDLPLAGPSHGRDQIVDDFLAAVVGERIQAGSRVFTFPTMVADRDIIALECPVSARTAAGVRLTRGLHRTK